MAIHDVDKGNDDRNSPMPNSHDVQEGIRAAHGTNSVNYVSDSTGTTNQKLLGGNFRLVKAGALNVVLANGSAGVITTTTTSTPHGLGYAPVPLAFLNNSQINGSGGYNLPLPITTSFATINSGGLDVLADICRLLCSSDGTNFYVIAYTSGTFIGTNYIINYYLYQQTIN